MTAQMVCAILDFFKMCNCVNNENITEKKR